MSLIGMFANIISPQPWVAEALCAEIGDGDLWFPIKGNSARPAKRVCEVCHIRAECLKYALDNNVKHGIFGGFSERDRDKLNRGRNPLRAGGRPVRRPNGHGYACKCVVCRSARAA